MKLRRVAGDFGLTAMLIKGKDISEWSLAEELVFSETTDWCTFCAGGVAPNQVDCMDQVEIGEALRRQGRPGWMPRIKSLIASLAIGIGAWMLAMPLSGQTTERDTTITGPRADAGAAG